MSGKVLFVDDEPNVLEGIRRTLGRRFDLTLAQGSGEGLNALALGPYAVVITDMRMPGMSGVQFLAQVRHQSPTAVRMVLSGQADLQATIDAVNEGHVFRFLTKPCTPEALTRAVDAGLEQYRLVAAEKVLLEQTLAGAVQVLTEILAVADPEAYGEASRIARYAEAMAGVLQVKDNWQVRLGGMLSQIGCVALPKELLAKARAGQELESAEQALFARRFQIAAKLIANIPRLEPVAAMIAGEPPPDRSSATNTAATGRLILQAAIEFEKSVSRGEPSSVALARTARAVPGLPPAGLAALGAMEVTAAGILRKAVLIRQLVPGMVLDEHVISRKGLRLVTSGQEVTPTLIERLRAFAEGHGVIEPVRVQLAVAPSGAKDQHT